MLVLVIRFPLQPSSWIPPNPIFSDLVINEDRQTERHCWKPPKSPKIVIKPYYWNIFNLETLFGHLLERVHSEALVHARTIAQEGSYCCFKEQSKVEHAICHSLFEQRIASCLADNKIGPLSNYNWHEICSLTGVLQNLSILIRLIDKKKIRLMLVINYRPIKLPIHCRCCQLDRQLPLSPMTCECPSSFVVGIHAQPWWQNIRRIQHTPRWDHIDHTLWKSF